jgi:hypothetical protein
MRVTHRHTWERVDFFRPHHAYVCKCGAALSVAFTLDGKSYYSPRRMVDNAWTWKEVKVNKEAVSA